MATKKDYIPKPHNEFNDFQLNLVTRSTTNAVAWGIAAGKITALTNAQGTYQPFYDAIVNPNDRTKAKNNGHKQARKTYVGVIRTFVKENLRYNTAIDTENKELLRINPGTNTASARAAITTAPYILLKSLGGMQFRAEFRVESDSSRPSMHPDADVVEVAIKLGGTPPPDHETGTTLFVSSKARVTELVTPPSLEGQKIYMFARWKNNIDDDKSGPWSGMASVTLS